MCSQLSNQQIPNPDAEDFVQNSIGLITMLEIICREISVNDAEADALSIEDWRLIERCLLGIRYECNVLNCAIFEQIETEKVKPNQVVLLTQGDASNKLATVVKQKIETPSSSQLDQRQPIFEKIKDHDIKSESDYKYLCDATGDLFGLICDLADKIADPTFPVEHMSVDDWSTVENVLDDCEGVANEVYDSLFETFDDSELTDPARVVVDYEEGGNPYRDAVRLA